MMNIKELGIFSRCQELGLDYENFHKVAGAVEVLNESSKTIEANKQIASCLYKVMESVNRGNTKAARHIKATATAEGWDSHRADVMDVIYNHFAGAHHLKQAGMLPLAFTGGKALALLSALTGAGVGALYWQIKRDSLLESSKAEQIKAQTKYYDQLSRDLESAMTEKFEYDDDSENEPES